MKLLPLANEMFVTDERTDRQPDMTKLIIDFRNYANVYKTVISGEIFAV